MPFLRSSLSLSTRMLRVHMRNLCTETAHPNVVVEELKGITLIGINRPEKRNCINPDTAQQLIAAFKSFEDNPDSPVAILYGKGGTFCAGYDLEYLALQQGKSGLDPLFFDPESKHGVGPMGPTRRIFKKPVIAAVAGYAVAGGLELALMCDLRVVEDTSVLGVFCRRFGVPLLDGGSVRLPHLIGLSRAMDMILTGRPVSGKEAFEIGLANRVTSCGTALGKAVILAQSIAKFPLECMNRDRISAYNSVYSAKNFQDAVAFEMKNGVEVLQTESIPGAGNFVKGVGRHGSFSLRQEENSEKVK